MTGRVAVALACIGMLLVPARPAMAKPNAPQGVQAHIASHQLTVGWLAFSDDGWGGPIDNYMVVVITPDNAVLTKYSTTSPVTFTGLRHGTHHYYVGAHNADGWGHVSATATVNVPSEPDRMSVPQASSEKPDTLTVTWTAPNSDGGSPITAWEVRFDGEVHAEPANARQATFPALGGTRHTIQVRARNTWGYGDYSGTHYAHARGLPGSVPEVTATTTDSTVHVTWMPAANDGGRAIDHYQVRVFSGAVSQEKPGLDHADFGGLSPGAEYRVSVAAVGYDESDGLGVLTGPAYKIQIYTKSAPPVPTPTGGGAGPTGGATPSTASTPTKPGGVSSPTGPGDGPTGDAGATGGPAAESAASPTASPASASANGVTPAHNTSDTRPPSTPPGAAGPNPSVQQPALAVADSPTNRWWLALVAAGLAGITGGSVWLAHVVSRRREIDG